MSAGMVQVPAEVLPALRTALAAYQATVDALLGRQGGRTPPAEGSPTETAPEALGILKAVVREWEALPLETRRCPMCGGAASAPDKQYHRDERCRWQQVLDYAHAD